MPIQIQIETVNDNFGCYFFFSGNGPDGEFCGSADDLFTAIDMALECLQVKAK